MGCRGWLAAARPSTWTASTLRPTCAWTCCVDSPTQWMQETFGYDSEPNMEHRLLHSYVSGFQLSAKSVGSCVGERHATAFLFLPSCSRLRPCCATEVAAAWASRYREALGDLRPHGPQQRWTTTVFQSVLAFMFLVCAFRFKIVGSCLSEAVAHEHDTQNIIRCSPIGFSGSLSLHRAVRAWMDVPTWNDRARQ